MYSWIKQRPYHMLHADTGYKTKEVVSRRAEILTEIDKYWSTIFNKPELKDWNLFHQRYGALIQSHPCIVDDISGVRLQRQFRRMGKTRAVAADGWRVGELRLLPLAICDLMAVLLKAVEDKWLSWPPVITLGITSCLPKWDPESDLAAEVEPDEVWLAAVDQTRPIANLSPIHTALSVFALNRRLPGEKVGFTLVPQVPDKVIIIKVSLGC